MKLLFWRKAKVVLPENCNHTDTKVRGLNSLDHIPLKDGHHTSFIVMKCERCGGMVGFPSDNLALALVEGTPAVKDQLRVLAERVFALPCH